MHPLEEVNSTYLSLFPLAGTQAGPQFSLEDSKFGYLPQLMFLCPVCNHYIYNSKIYLRGKSMLMLSGMHSPPPHTHFIHLTGFYKKCSSVYNCVCKVSFNKMSWL